MEKIDSVNDIYKDILESTQYFTGFWKDPTGWAPQSSTNLLINSQIELIYDFTISLKKWILQDPDIPMSKSDLILAYTSLGALVESILILMNSIYFDDYKKINHHSIYKNNINFKLRDNNLENNNSYEYRKSIKPAKFNFKALIKDGNIAIDNKTEIDETINMSLNISIDLNYNHIKKPYEQTLENIKQVSNIGFLKNNYRNKNDINWFDWITTIQNKRNSIHFIKNRDIGCQNKFNDDIKIYLKFIKYINDCLIYPEDYQMETYDW